MDPAASINANNSVWGHTQTVYDLCELLRIGRQIPDTNYIFIANCPDRSYYSLEFFTGNLHFWVNGLIILHFKEEIMEVDR